MGSEKFGFATKARSFCVGLAMAGAFLSLVPPSSRISAQDRRDSNLLKTGSLDEIALARSISLDYLRDRISSLGLKNPDDLQITRIKIDGLSMAHTRVRQIHGGVPVFGGEAIVHLKRDGSVSAVTDTLVKNIRVNTKPVLDPQQATNLALLDYGCSDCLTANPKSDLWVLRHKGKDHLVYRVQLERIDPQKLAKPVYFIDAETGAVVMHYDNLQTATGNSLYDGTVSFTTSQAGGLFYLQDVGRKHGTFECPQLSCPTLESLGRYTDSDNIWVASDQRAAVNAHHATEKTFDYYGTVHGRTGRLYGADGDYIVPAAADPSVNLFGTLLITNLGFNDAFFGGPIILYGDGDEVLFGPLVSLDIVAHELTHGVTADTANLIYMNESGALNESMSDVFGAMAERFARGGTATADTWKLIEQPYTPGNGDADAFRWMSAPHNAPPKVHVQGGPPVDLTADDDPDHYSERYVGDFDNGGVHINSGIPNHVFYLVAAGGTHHLSLVPVKGIGANKAEKIWYRALTLYMTESTDFAGALEATVLAANDLYGVGAAATVATAWGAVGVVP